MDGRLLEAGADVHRKDYEGRIVVDRKRIQYQNGLAYQEKNVDTETDPEKVERYRVSNAHDEAVMELLKKQMERK